MSFVDGYEGKYCREYCTVSHRWERPQEPDGEGVQLTAIQEYLKAHQEVKYIWFDYWCMPQAPRNDEAEKREFKTMLSNVNLLYLSTQVIILLDLTYMGRFWTSFEAYLSMQATSVRGLAPASDEERRFHIICLHNAT
eukprot:765541-Amphidinium_carterae.1